MKTDLAYLPQWHVTQSCGQDIGRVTIRSRGPVEVKTQVYLQDSTCIGEDSLGVVLGGRQQPGRSGSRQAQQGPLHDATNLQEETPQLQQDSRVTRNLAGQRTTVQIKVPEIAKC